MRLIEQVCGSSAVDLGKSHVPKELAIARVVSVTNVTKKERIQSNKTCEIATENGQGGVC